MTASVKRIEEGANWDDVGAIQVSTTLSMEGGGGGRGN